MTSFRHSLNGKSNYSSQFFPQLENDEAVNLILEFTLADSRGGGGWGKRNNWGKLSRRSCVSWKQLFSFMFLIITFRWGKYSSLTFSPSIPGGPEKPGGPMKPWKRAEAHYTKTSEPGSQILPQKHNYSEEIIRDFLLVLLGHPDIFLFLWLLLYFDS